MNVNENEKKREEETGDRYIEIQLLTMVVLDSHTKCNEVRLS